MLFSVFSFIFLDSSFQAVPGIQRVAARPLPNLIHCALQSISHRERDGSIEFKARRAREESLTVPIQAKVKPTFPSRTRLERAKIMPTDCI